MLDKLENYIKYCLGYIKLTRRRSYLAQLKLSVDISENYFDLRGLLNGDLDGRESEQIKLETFYSFDPKKVPEEKLKEYEEQKSIASKIEEIYNKYRNTPYTKQILLNFGYLKIEIPIDESEQVEDIDEDNDKNEKPEKLKVDKYPLFTLPINIEKNKGKYEVFAFDPTIQINIGSLEPLLGSDSYYQLVEDLGNFEIEGKLSIPFEKDEVFYTIWHKIKDLLKLSDAQFDENSFKLEEMRIALGPKVNYFIAEDLQKLTEMTEEELAKTSLSCWISEDELNIDSGIPKESELYFPFPYDKFKKNVTRIIQNRASIIQGPPGTGKSQTIANLLCHFAAKGKRVLFVSQQSQALKVVKDMLKKTQIKYLFGYVPNPRSAQLGIEDEIDGVAPQLSALEQYLERMGIHYNPRSRLLTYKNQDENTEPENSINDVIKEKYKNKKLANTLLDKEREIWDLKNECEKLKKYDVKISSFSKFKQYSQTANFNWNNLNAKEEEIKRLSGLIKNYKKSDEYSKYRKIFNKFNLEKENYNKEINTFYEDIKKTAYDRHSKFVRYLNNAIRRRRLAKTRSTLPRELIDYVDELLGKDISKNQIVSKIKPIVNYSDYCENSKIFSSLSREFDDQLSNLGVNYQEYAKIDLLVKEDKGSFKETISKIIEFRETERKISRYKSNDANQIMEDYKSNETVQSNTIIRYIQNIIDNRISDIWKDGGVSIKRIVKKLAKTLGKSKRAFKTFDKLRNDPDVFMGILDLIPVWMMELDDASRIVPLKSNQFDYLVLDEASQCNVAYTLPAMFRAKRVIFVGDSEQMRDSTIRFKSNKSFDELARRYTIPEELQIKATGTSVQSVLDIADLLAFKSVPLRFHYRSPKELIGFSNENFYKPKGKDLITLNSNYLTYNSTDRVMLVHKVESDWSKEISDQINVAEAIEILKLFKKIRSDGRYKDKSVGILTFFNKQATFLRELFEKEDLIEEGHDYKISIIEGIQGDEKDIIIYSFVIRDPGQKKKYVPLTGEGGDIQAGINKGRVNVAFSRAKLQTHCFVSMDPKDFPDKIWLKKYLEYVEENGKVDFFETKLKPFDSEFEEDFYNEIRSYLDKNFLIQNQVESCGFRIDFVVTNSKTGKRLAIECDGPTHFEDEIDEELGIYVVDDVERQQFLEAAGWRFYRLLYSDWIKKQYNKKETFDEIKKMLQ